MSVTFDADLFGRRLKRLYEAWKVREVDGRGELRGAALASKASARRPISGRAFPSDARPESPARPRHSTRAHALHARPVYALTHAHPPSPPPPQTPKADPAAWASADALAVALGTSLEENRYRKTTAVHLWLFTYELPGE